jgi:hypothetical protein
MLFVLYVPKGYRVKVVARKDGTVEISLEPIGSISWSSQPISPGGAFLVRFRFLRRVQPVGLVDAVL